MIYILKLRNDHACCLHSYFPLDALTPRTSKGHSDKTALATRISSPKYAYLINNPRINPFIEMTYY